VDDDSAVVQGRSEHPLCNGSLAHLSTEGCVEDRGARSAERFCLVHGHIGFVEQGLRRPSPVNRDGDADARGNTFTVLDPFGTPA
jgi:hypothetical protein